MPSKEKTFSLLFTELYASDSTAALLAVGVDESHIRRVDISHHRRFAGVGSVVDTHEVADARHRDVRVASSIAGSLDWSSHMHRHIVQATGDYRFK